MKFPVSVTISGDLVRARMLQGKAMKELRTLEESMGFQGLAQGVRRVSLGYGNNPLDAGSIEAESRFGIRQVHIHVPVFGGAAEEPALSWYWYATNQANHDAVWDVRESLAGALISPPGNVFVTGFSNTTSGGTFSNEPIIMKYSRDGEFRNRRVLPGGSVGGVNMDVAGTALAYDKTSGEGRGGVYLLSDEYISRNGDSYDSSVSKFTPYGVIKWRRKLTFSAQSLVDYVFASWGMDADTVGNAVSCGVIYVWGRDDVGSDWELDSLCGYLFSLRYDGVLNWHKKLGDSFISGPRQCEIKDVATDSNNNIFAVGPYLFTHAVSGPYPEGLIVKLDSDGDVTWKRAIHTWTYSAAGGHGLYAPGTMMEGCATDAAGAVYTVSWGRLTEGPYLTAEEGHFHFHVTKFLADGTFSWQRIVETEFSSNEDGTRVRTRICVDGDAVYAVFPRHPDRDTDVPWSILVFKFALDGTVVWQREIKLHDGSFGQYPDTFGIFPYDIAADRSDIVIVGQLSLHQATLTIKLPGDGGFLGYHSDLHCVDPELTVYEDIEDVPVRFTTALPEESIYDPSFKMDVITDVPLTIADGPMSVATQTEEPYGAPSRGKTSLILKREHD